MTTRVQKGGPIFKPVPKPRARAVGDARHTSVASSPETHLAVGPSPSQALSPVIPPPPSHLVLEVPEGGEPEAIAQAELSSTLLMTRNSRPPAVQSVQARAPHPKPPFIASSFTIPPISSAHSVIQLHSQSTPHHPKPPLQPAPPPPTPSEEAPATTTIPAVVVGPARAPISPSEIIVQDLRPPQFDNSQIDRALLEAVVTALQLAERNSTSTSTSNTTAFHAAPAAPTLLPESSQQLVQRHAEGATQVRADRNYNDNTENAVARPRTRRTKRAAISQGERPDDGGEGAGCTVDSSVANTKMPRKRKRTDSTVTSQPEDEGEKSEDASARRKLRLSGGKKPKPPAIPRYDAEADPGEEIDPTSVTMGALCDDQGTGRVSSKAAQIVTNHASWRSTNREKRARMREIMEAKKYGRNLEEEEEETETNGGAPKETSTAIPEEVSVTTPNVVGPVEGLSSALEGSVDEQSKKDNFDYSQAMSTSRYNVQVRIGPNGETIIDEESLFVDNNEEEDTAAYTHVEESDATKFINSATYSKKSRGSRWSAEETELFFDALSQFGENYELISFVLPGRDRKACKNKFKAEDRRDSARITYCLKNRRPYDIATLSRMTGKDFSGPTPVIRTPTPISTAETPALNPDTETAASTNSAKTSSKRKKPSKTVSADEEIIGNVSDLEDDSADLALTLLRG